MRICCFSIDEPKLKNINGNNAKVEETALLGSTVDLFECLEFEANPPAQYRWVHVRGSLTETIENHVQNKGGGRRLHLQNIMWSDEGEYRCIAFNTINGVRRETVSDERYMLHVTGPPEIQARPLPSNKDFYESIGWTGEPVHRLKSRFCSWPPPKLVAWQWGSSHIRAGTEKYLAEQRLKSETQFLTYLKMNKSLFSISQSSQLGIPNQYLEIMRSCLFQKIKFRS